MGALAGLLERVIIARITCALSCRASAVDDGEGVVAVAVNVGCKEAIEEREGEGDECAGEGALPRSEAADRRAGGT